MSFFFFFSSRRRHTSYWRDWSSDVCSSDLEPGGALYNIPVALRVEGPLDPGVLARTLGEIVRRHEALRTVFAAPEGSPVQVVQPAAPFALPVVDLAGLPGLSDPSDRTDRSDRSNAKARQA